MGPKNAILQSSWKVIQLTSQGSTTANVTYSEVMTRNIGKAVVTMAMRQLAVIVPSQSRKIQNLGPNLVEAVNQIASHSSNPIFTIGLNM